MSHWPTWVVALVSLAVSVGLWLTGDRVGVERRVATLEGQAAANQETLRKIQEDVREIHKFLLGERK